ncbi:uncharacterized protein K02A2.6-like [Ischnura elegans]|uniref:uncharacterized protein K02A2.6-like n=1 Tax=Ischnura elegans TaxID=197161 RepID=UPI001ED8A39D|nr:uncharacterized protein K02A2.6-like [Ischnura elegans]
MKSVARSYVWWPKLDEDLEALARACTACAENKPLPNKAPLKCWERPDKPWVRLHIDLAGPFMSKVFLVVVDSSTKWPEVFQLSNSSSEEILGHLRALFAIFGLPEEIVSDNGTPFTSWEFQNFCSMNGIRHRFSPPYHPATNGAAENLVKCFKSKIKTLVNSNVPLHIALQRFLFDCRISPHSTTGEPPSLLMFGRVLRSRLSLLKPSINQTVTTKQEHQKRSHGTSTQLRTFNVGDKVWATAYTRGGARQWKETTVVSVLGSRNYRVETKDGSVWHRHIDQLREVGTGVIGRAEETQVSSEMKSELIVPGKATAMSCSRSGSSEPVGYWQTGLGKGCDNVGSVQNDSIKKTGGDSEPCVQEMQTRYPKRARKVKEMWNV